MEIFIITLTKIFNSPHRKFNFCYRNSRIGNPPIRKFTSKEPEEHQSGSASNIKGAAQVPRYKHTMCRSFPATTGERKKREKEVGSPRGLQEQTEPYAFAWVDRSFNILKINNPQSIQSTHIYITCSLARILFYPFSPNHRLHLSFKPQI